MVSRRRLTDQMCCWVQIIVLVTLILGDVSHAQSKIIIEMGCPGGSLLLIVLRGSGLQIPISQSFAVALARYLGILLLMTLRQCFEVDILFEFYEGL